MIFRINKSSGYTVMSNYHLKDKYLSLKAKGLLSQMLSLPEDWDYSIAGLASINKEQKDAIMAALKELKAAGYVTVTKLMPNETKSGRFEYVYDVFEQPKTRSEKQHLEIQDVDIQGIEKQGIEKQAIENPTQLNTNKQITNKQITKEYINNNKPTVEEVAEYCRERGNSIDAQEFVDYYQSQKWTKANGRPLADWKAGVRYWERKERNKKPKQEREQSFDISEVEKLFADDLKGMTR